MMHGPSARRAARSLEDKPKNFRKSLKELINYLGRYKFVILIVFLFAIGSTAANIFGPKILGRATTTLFEGILDKLTGVGDIDFDAIGRIILLTLGLYLLSAIFSYIQGWIMANVSTNITYRLRKDISLKINKLPLKYFDKTTQGETLSRITNDVDTINQTLSQSLTQIITSLVTVIGVLIMMLTISWLLTLVTLFILPLSGIVVSRVVKRSQKYFQGQQKLLGEVNGHVEEMYGGHIIMKAFNGEQKSLEKFDTSNNALYHTAWKSQFLSALIMPLMIFIGNLGYVTVAIVGGWLAVIGTINIGEIQAFIQYVRSFTQPISQLASISNTLQQTSAAAERVFEFLNEEEEIPESASPVKPTEIQGYVEFSHVKFGYDPDKIIIHDFSAQVQPGQKIAIVGPTGAGKTTMVKLLMRYYDVNEGNIYIDGHEIREFTRRDLRSLFGMVLQETWLYNGSVMDNIRYSNLTATDEEVIAAAKAAHVDHFIHTLPNGYDMVINEEVNNISQGQMQLLTIARAILADPHMLILDEATSSVDTKTEILIQKAMDRLMEGRTSFVIAHRLSTIRDADLILVMNEGDIVEKGTHTELLARGGFYSEIYYSQFEKQLTI